MKTRKGTKVTVMAVAALLATVLQANAGYGSQTKAASDSSATSSSSHGSSKAYTIGVLTDITGTGAYSLSTEQGVQAGIGVAEQAGYHIKYIVADTQSSPAGALAAAQRLVLDNHVFAIIMNSAVGFGASAWLTAKGVPVIGADTDGPEWQTSPNMFSVLPVIDPTKVTSTIGEVFKQLGATNIATLGYGISPSSADAANATALSAEAAGLKAGYINANLPFGSSNVGPIALAMKSAGVDGYNGAVQPQTNFSLIAALKDLGVTLKVVINDTGYGGDLVQGGKEAETLAEGEYFFDQFEPVELHTSATQRFVEALKEYAKVTGEPTFAGYVGYLAVDGFVKGLEAAGSDPTQASYIKSMLGVNDYDGAGLYGGHTISFSRSSRVQKDGGNLCEWVTLYTGGHFQPVQGDSPICGTIVPGKTV
jgi:branched-chain amino acid transport system substrate-binding protein